MENTTATRADLLLPCLWGWQSAYVLLMSKVQASPEFLSIQWSSSKPKGLVSFK